MPSNVAHLCLCVLTFIVVSLARQSVVCKFAHTVGGWGCWLCCAFWIKGGVCVCVSRKWWENSIITFSIHFQNIPPCHCNSPATWQEKHQRLPQQYIFLKEADLLTHVWWKRITQPSLGRRYLLYFSLCVWCLVAMALWESWLCRLMGAVTQRFFVAFGMGWLWTHCNQEVRFINTRCDRGLLWPARWAELSFRWRQQQTAAQQNTRQLHYVDFSSIVLGYSSRVLQKHTQQQVGPSVQLTGHTCLAQRHDTASLHTHLCMHNY